MLYAVNGNKQLKIDDAEADTYLKLGYDIAKQNGDKLETIETAPSKTVSAKQYEALAKENADLKAQIEAAGSGTNEALDGLKAQLADLQKENKALKKQITDAE